MSIIVREITEEGQPRLFRVVRETVVKDPLTGEDVTQRELVRDTALDNQQSITQQAQDAATQAATVSAEETAILEYILSIKPHE